jgi:hypothetical protein
MGKEVNIDWKKFGEDVLSGNFKPTLDDYVGKDVKKLSSFLTRIQQDEFIKKYWPLLWKWRFIREKQGRIMFFKVQAFLRNAEAKMKQQEFVERNNQEGFWEYVDKNYHIPYRYLYLFLLKTDFFPFSNKELSECSADSAVIEVFKYNEDACYGIDGAYEEYEADPENWPQTADAINKRIWDETLEYDMSVVKSDRYFEEPVIYLRVDLRHTQREIIERVKKIVNSNRMKLGCNSQRNISEKSMESALMVHDLRQLGMNNDDISSLIGIVTDEIIDPSTISKKYDASKELIANSIKINFPFDRV